MKTLVVTLDYPPQVGGVANYIEQFLRYQDPTNTVVIAPYAKGDTENDARWPWKVVRTNPSWPFIWPHWLPLYWQAKKAVQQHKIEEMHVHQVLPVGYIAYHLKKKKRLAHYKVFLHGTDVIMAGKEKRKLKWFKTICAAADEVVVNSEYLKMKVAGLVPSARIVVVHPCPADYFFAPAAPERLAARKAELAITGRKTFLTVGRMVEGKGFPHILRILPKVLQKIPDAVWLVVGSGPKRQELLALIQKNGLQNAVRFLGDIPHEALPEIYQLADAFVMLTHPDKDTEESWGTVFLEAAASGLPVVAGKSGGVAEAVLDGKTGLVVDAANDERAVAAIVTVLSDTALAKQLGDAGLARVKTEFTWDKQLANL